MNFRFASKGNPMGYVSRLAGFMQIYPPDLSVAGASVLYDYDPDLVRELLEYLVPENMLVLAVGREFKGKTDKVSLYPVSAFLRRVRGHREGTGGGEGLHGEVVQ